MDFQSSQNYERLQEELKKLLLEECLSGGEEEVVSYLPKGVARKVFRYHASLLKELYNAAGPNRRNHPDQSAKFLEAVVGRESEDDDDALSNILAILLYGPIRPTSQSWKSFEALCKQPARDRKFSDGKLPLLRQEVDEFLGKGNIHRDNFWKSQSMFSPIGLQRRKMYDGTQGRKLGDVPRLNQDFRGEGSHGMVYQVTLAGDHFGLASNKRSVCARKDYNIADQRAFDAEWKYVELLSTSKKRNANILETFAGLRTPNVLSLFCELADCDLRDFMTKVELAEPPKDLSGLRHRLAQFNGIVRAVEFLHTGLQPENGTTRESCFHLDLKPENILVFNRGKGREEIFKISDFSISRSKNQDEYREKLFVELQKSVRDMSTVARLGDSNTCLAPEAYGSKGRVNASNDVWHLDCLLCMFIAWLDNGPSGLKDFNEKRRSEQTGADWFFFSGAEEARPMTVDEKDYCRQLPDGSFLIFTLSLKVEEWLTELEERTTGKPEAAIYSNLVRILKNNMLVADPQERDKIEKLCFSLDSVINQHVSGQNRKDVTPKAPSSGRLTARPGRSK